MMHICFLLLVLMTTARSAARENLVPKGRKSDPVKEQNKVHVNYVVEPTDDGKGTRTVRGPGGYTDDEETWSCMNACDIKPSDCTSVRTTLQDMGGQDGWWWMPDTAGCNSWQQGNCKATFCPLNETANIDKRDEYDGMRVSAPRLAKHLRLMGAICAEDGRRGYMTADNGTWSLWLTEKDWQLG